MKRTSIAAIAALAALGFGFSMTAVAQHGGGKHAKRGHHGGMMMKADTDGDGAVTRAEFDAANAARFAKLDTNGDGTVTKEEMQAVRAAKRAERRAARFAKVDTNGDGQISLAEQEVADAARHERRMQMRSKNRAQ